MSEGKHTPGPWALEFDKFEQGEWVIRSADGAAMMGNSTYYPWQSSNVHDAVLISAAPEMLEALRDLLVLAQAHYPIPAAKGEIVRASAAISKAKGINPDE